MGNSRLLFYYVGFVVMAGGGGRGEEGGERRRGRARGRKGVLFTLFRIKLAGGKHGVFRGSCSLRTVRLFLFPLDLIKG